MKKLMTIACLLVSPVALSACGSTGVGYVDTQPPYEHERTATYGSEPAPAPVVRQTRSAAPVFETRVLK